MKRRIVAVTLPADVVEELGLKKGQEVDVTVHPVTRVVMIRAAVKFYEGGKLTKRARADIERLIRENRTLYERLAK
jgi:antitoxin component of MazEF toxin-antitoxin module